MVALACILLAMICNLVESSQGYLLVTVISILKKPFSPPSQNAGLRNLSNICLLDLQSLAQFHSFLRVVINTINSAHTAVDVMVFHFAVFFPSNLV